MACLLIAFQKAVLALAVHREQAASRGYRLFILVDARKRQARGMKHKNVLVGESRAGKIVLILGCSTAPIPLLHVLGKGILRETIGNSAMIPVSIR